MRATPRFLIALGVLLFGTLMALAFVGANGPASTKAAALIGKNTDAPLVTPTCGPIWYADTTPNVGATDNALAGVAVVSSSDVWAVGFYTDTNGLGNTLIENYNGTAWSIVASPHPGTGGSYLQAVNVVAANDVWAVGYYRATAGSVTQTLALHYDGTNWTQSTTASPGTAENYLYGVAMVSATDGWAVGYTSDSTNIYKTLTLRWNGTQWSQVASPTPFLSVAGLRGVVVVSANEVWAVGVQVDISLTYRMYTIKWNGSTWSAITAPNTSGCVLTAVNIASGSDLWAVGGCQTTGYQTAIIKWNGTSWSTVASPSPGTGDNLLGGVVSTSAVDAYAVGGYNDLAGNTQTLGLHWDGTAWTQIQSDNPGSSENALFAVAKDPASSIGLWAAGTQASGSAGQTLAEHIEIVPCGATATPTQAVTGTATSTAQASSTATAQPSSTSTLSTPVATSTATAGTPAATSSSTATIEATSTATTVPATGTAATATSTVVATSTSVATETPGTPGATATVCTLQFEDVPVDNTFYSFVRCLACRGIINGYPCGDPSEPCNGNNDPYFRPSNNITRAQIAKIVSNSAGFSEEVSGQTFDDVYPGSTFYPFVERLASRGIMSGYACGGAIEPCGPENRPYFRPNSKASRGQLAKIVSNAANFQDVETGQTFEDVAPGSTFYDFVERLASRAVMGGYPCGGATEPCDSENRPYFRPGNNVTRGQTSKILGNTFFPECSTP